MIGLTAAMAVALAALGAVAPERAPRWTIMTVDPDKKAQILNDLRSQLARLGYDGKRRAQAAPRRDPEKPKADVPVSAPRAPIVYHRDLPPPSQSAAGSSRLGDQHRVVLEDAITNGTEIVTDRGPMFEIRHPVRQVAGAEGLSSTFSNHLFDSASPLCAQLRPTLDPDDLTVQDMVFMDIETTGLSSSPLFLIGIMVWEDTGFVVRQFFARNYAEEAATILRFAEECAPRRLLVTFNGKSFDYPYIRTRAMATGVPFDVELAHLDLLHVGRRIWKATLPNCKLQTIEKHVCGRTRRGDIPGSEIPDAYHAYVRSDDAWQMVEALKHNMLDLVTLADMMTRFPPIE